MKKTFRFKLSKMLSDWIYQFINVLIWLKFYNVHERYLYEMKERSKKNLVTKTGHRSVKLC